MKLESNYGHIVEGLVRKFLVKVEEDDKSFWLLLYQQYESVYRSEGSTMSVKKQ